jgi:hypothetical protein
MSGNTIDRGHVAAAHPQKGESPEGLERENDAPGRQPLRDSRMRATKSHPKRRRADYRKTAIATRRILIEVGRPLRNKEIYARLPADLRDGIASDKLFRILGASRRAGLISTSDGWWVRKEWLGKPNKEWRRKLSGSSLAKVRRKLDRACDSALDWLRVSGTAKGIDDLLAAASDKSLDRGKFIRALWNRAQRDPRLHRLADGCYLWMPARPPLRVGGHLHEVVNAHARIEVKGKVE